MEVPDTRLETTANDVIWMEKYRRLEAFYMANGHCNVPRSHDDKALASWVANQRSFQRAGTMRKDREQMLNELGFTWRTNNSNKKYQEADSILRAANYATSPSAISKTPGPSVSSPSAAPPPANENTTPKVDQKFAIGTRIEKVFELDGKSESFGGNIAAFEQYREEDGTLPWGYLIHYDDGDREHMLEADVAKNVVAVKRKKRTAKSLATPKPSKRMKHTSAIGKAKLPRLPRDTTHPTNHEASAIPAREKEVSPLNNLEIDDYLSSSEDEPLQSLVQKRKATVPEGAKRRIKTAPTKKTQSKHLKLNPSKPDDKPPIRKGKVIVPTKAKNKKNEAPTPPPKTDNPTIAKKKNKVAPPKLVPSDYLETSDSSSSEDKPLVVSAPKVKSQTAAQRKTKEKQILCEVIDLCDDADDSTTSDSLPTFASQSPSKPMPPHQRFPMGTPISRKFFDLSDNNEREKLYGGKVIDYVYLDEEEKDWFYFVQYDDGDGEFMDEWEVARFSASIV